MALLNKTTLQKSVGLLNATAPEDHFLAYITGNERDMLIQAGGKETSTPSGIFAYPPPGERGGGGYMGSSSDKTTSSSRDYGFSGGGGDDRPDRPSPHTDSGTVKRDFTKAELGIVDAEDEYMEPDKDHWKATQKAIQESQKPYINEKGEKVDPYKADWNDWTKEQQESYQLEMNKLKGTTDKNYSFYKGNEGTTNLSFNEHWKDVAATNPKAAASPLLRLLIAGGRTLKENFTTDYGTWKYGAKEGTGSGTPFDSGGWFGKIFNKDGSVKTNLTDDQINDAYNQATPDLAPIIGGTTPQPSMAAQWYANLGGNSGGFNLTTAYAAAKSKVAQTLGSPSAVGQLAVNQSPFYDWLKKNSLNKGIL